MKAKLNILYVSTLCSERLISEMLNCNLGMPHQAAQKYHRLLVQGMVLNGDLFNINTLCVPEYSRSIDGRKYIHNNSEIENGVLYKYAPIVLLPVIKRIILTFYLSCKIIRWRITSRFKTNIVVFDILNINTSIVSLFVTKIFRIPSVAIVTDLPQMLLVLKAKVSFSYKLFYRILNLLMTAPDGYIFLTEAMNSVVNKKGKPYCIIEGLADVRLLSVENDTESNVSLKIVHYSGGLYEKFGVRTLIDAFMLLEIDGIKLHLFGNGDLVDYINKCKEKDPRIVFFGYKDNKMVINDQINSFVLVNPRFTNEEYTKYSFPSKTIEYMASGIPLMTTKLPGIPEEYLKFVYIFEYENVEGYRSSLEKVLKKSKDEIIGFGKQARNFVLLHKNNNIQAKNFYEYFINKF